MDPKSGKVFCLSTGPDREAVMRVHERAGHPTSEVYEVPIEV
ncbi:nickel-binding protein [Streptacidiphilus monticola]